MPKKVARCAWTKGKRHPEMVGTKNEQAHDLLLMGGIRLSKKDCEKLDIREQTPYEVNRISALEAARMLESKGWKWTKAS